MRLEIPSPTTGTGVEIVLSRRNLKALLAKLDGNPPDSKCAILGGVDAPGIVVKAEEDDVHYGSRGFPPGQMVDETEAALEQS